MNKRQIKECISEFAGAHQNAGSDEIALLEAALFVEDVSGIVLSDDEICEKNLGTHGAIENFVLERLLKIHTPNNS